MTWVTVERGGKPTKVPMGANGRPASSTDPATWMTLDYALGDAEFNGRDGIGFVLGDGFAGLDLDDVIVDGKLTEAAEYILKEFPSYTEVSPSGTGVKVFGRARVPSRRQGWIEWYSTGRYFTVTGQQFGDHAALADLTDGATWLTTEYMAPAPHKTDAEEHTLHLDGITDQEVRRRAEAARSWLWGQAPTIQGKGNGADGYCLKLAAIVRFGFAIPADVAVDILTEWGHRPDHTDRDGNPWPWTRHEMERKVSAARCDQPPGWKLAEARDQEREGLVHDIVKAVAPPAKVAAVPAPVEAQKDDRRRRGFKLGELRNLPPVRYQIKNHFATNSLVCLYGPSGAGKSFLAVEMAMAIATGRPYLGTYDVRQGPVVYLSGEGNSSIGRRFEAWCKFHRVDYPDNLVVVPYQFDFQSRAEVDEVLNIVADSLGTAPATTIIDTVARYYGAADENSTRDMGNFISSVDYYRSVTGGTAILPHHTGKDPSKGERGNSALRAACDTMISVEETSKGTASLVSCSKQKDFEAFNTYVTDRRIVHLGQDDEGEDITSCVLHVQDATQTKYQLLTKKRKEQLAALFATFSSRHFGLPEVQEALKLGRSAAAELLRELTTKGLITNDGGRYTVAAHIRPILLVG